MKEIKKSCKSKADIYSINKIRIYDISVNEVYRDISKVCWKSNTEFKVLYKDRYILNIILKGISTINYITFQRKDVSTENEIYEFYRRMKIWKADKGVFITTGIFERKVYRNRCFYHMKHIWIEDGRRFLGNKKNIGYMDFYKYIPK